jgi:RNA polymerase sigma-70 factor, ECF subfamily
MLEAMALKGAKFAVPVEEKLDRIADLVDRASKGSGEAFGQLYQLYVDRIYNYIYYKTGHSVDAEDLTEQVFIKAWEAIRRFRFEGKPFAAWLFKVARNVVIDHYRTRKNNSDLSEVISAIAKEGDPEAFAQRRATAQVLMTAIRRLTDEQQQVILLKFIDGMDNTEISAAMGKKEGAIRALQYRALLALQRILQDERYGLERTPARATH